MRFGPQAESLSERLALGLGLVPIPLIETQGAFLLSRTIMAASSLGIFDALADGPRTPAEVAARCATHAAATRQLLRALHACGYLVLRGERYGLARMARKWLLRGAPFSLHDKMLFQFLEWDWMSQLERYARSGATVDIHAHIQGEQWQVYQRAMRAVATVTAGEVGRRTPMPRGARTLLDIGGAHGLYAASLCRRRARLSAVILDLPQAVAAAAPLLAREGLGERVRHQAGDALTTELGEARYDVVFVANLVHHFTAEQNRGLARRVARALRPGGTFVVQELLRVDGDRPGAQLGALLDLYFAFTSTSGAWSAEEIHDWQRDAGLAPRPTLHLQTFPGAALVVARKRS